MAANILDIPWGVWQHHIYESGYLNFVEITQVSQTCKHLSRKIFDLEYFLSRRTQCKLYHHAFKCIKFCDFAHVEDAKDAVNKLFDSILRHHNISPHHGIESILGNNLSLGFEMGILHSFQKLFKPNVESIADARNIKDFLERFKEYRRIASKRLPYEPSCLVAKILKSIGKLLIGLDMDASLSIALELKSKNYISRYLDLMQLIIRIKIFLKNDEEGAWTLLRTHIEPAYLCNFLPLFSNFERSITTVSELPSSLRFDALESLSHTVATKNTERALELPAYLETAEERDELRSHIAISLTRKGEYYQASECLANLEENSSRLKCDGHICCELEDETNTEIEFHLIQLISDEETRFQYLTDHIGRLGNIDLERALSLAEKIPDPILRQKARYFALSHSPKFCEEHVEALKFGTTFRFDPPASGKFHYYIAKNLLSHSPDLALFFTQGIDSDYKNPILFDYVAMQLHAKQAQKAEEALPYFTEQSREIASIMLRSSSNPDELTVLQDIHAADVNSEIAFKVIPSGASCADPIETFSYLQNNFNLQYIFPLFTHACSSLLKTRGIFETLCLLETIPAWTSKPQKLRFNVQHFIVNAKCFSSLQEAVDTYHHVNNNLLAKVHVLTKISEMRPVNFDFNALKQK